MACMRKNIYKFFVLSQIILLLFTGIGTVSAKDLLQQTEQDSIYTFKELGYTERVMMGPYDSARLIISLPPTWELTTNSKITLRYKFNSTNTITGTAFQDGRVGGFLTVRFNGVVIDTIVLDQYLPVVRELSIPAEALTPVTEDGRHVLSIFMDASFDCDKGSQSTFVLSADSAIDLQHTEVPPVIDLAQFPNSIYRPDPLIPINTVMVIPDQPSEVELQAAMAASSGIGSVTNGEMVIPLITVGSLNQDVLSTSNLIFVGSPTKFPVLGSVEFPIQVANNKLSINGAQDDDGIIQMAPSPWNPARVAYFISGNTDVGILKAGQTIGTGYIVTSGRPDISVIRSVTPQSNQGVIAENQTFADLGYGNRLMGIDYEQEVTYSFFASAEQAASTDGYLDLIVSRTSLIDKEKSGVSVLLNGDLIGTIGFTETTEDQIVITRFKFFAGLLNRGENYIDIISNLVPLDVCSTQAVSGATITIAESSLIHLPTTSPVAGLGNEVFLNSFPAMFLTQKDLSDLSIIVPSNDPVSWNYASRIAYYVGDRGGVTISDISVAFGENVSDEVRSTKNMILVGRASILPVVSEMGSAMPAPFEAGSDEAIQPSMMVNYRLLPGVNVGYLQLFTSPWNTDKVILAVMANSPEGLPLAGDMMVTDTSIEKLGGNFSIIYGAQVLNTDTRLGVGSGGLVSELPVAVTVTPSGISQDSQNTPATPEIEGRPTWIMPVLLVLLFASLVVVGIAIRRSFAGSAKKMNVEQDKK